MQTQNNDTTKMDQDKKMAAKDDTKTNGGTDKTQTTKPGMGK
jgi:hypothetical protein